MNMMIFLKHYFIIGENMTEQELLKELNRLEVLAMIYSDRDRIRYDEIQANIRKLEMELLDFMVTE
jgi:hypothetical protein